MFSFYKKCIIFILLSLVFLKCLDSLIIHDKLLHTTLNNLEEHKDNYDYIYMGNSLSRRSYNVNYIDSILSTKSINIGSEAQHFLITNAIFDEYIIKKKLHPKKMLIVTISPWQFSEIDEKWWMFLQMASLDELNYSKNYFNLLNRFYDVKNFNKVLSKTVRFHSNWSKNIIETNTIIKNFDKADSNGFTLNIGDVLNAKERFEKKDLNLKVSNYYKNILKSNEVNLEVDEEKCLLNIVKKCKEYGIEVLFITPPSIENIYNKHGQGIIKGIKNLLAKNHVKYINLNNYFNQMGLSFDDFSDFSHLNRKGNKKIAPFVLNLLEKKKIFDLPKLKNKKLKRKENNLIIVDDYKNWGKVRVELKKEVSSINENQIFNLKRTSFSQSSFIHTKPFKVDGVKKYKVSIKVKKGNNGIFFGLRIQGKYPQRVDAIFNLREGTLYGIDELNGFKHENFALEKLKNDWYKCSLTVQVSSKDLRIIFGPTVKENSILGWEGKVNKKNDIYIVPSSFTIEEVF